MTEKEKIWGKRGAGNPETRTKDISGGRTNEMTIEKGERQTIRGGGEWHNGCGHKSFELYYKKNKKLGNDRLRKATKGVMYSTLKKAEGKILGNHGKRKPRDINRILTLRI